MEIPIELKKLYKHWDIHTKAVHKNTVFVLPKDLILFITERMRVWENKQQHITPYTKNKILQKYRFCNIYRELDKQTIEIHTQLKPLLNNPPMWLLNLAYQRFVCKPETVTKTGPLSFIESENLEVYEKLMNLPKPKYGSAYVFPISIIQNSKYATREKFFCLYLPTKIKQIAKTINSFDNLTVNQALEAILPLFGFNFRFHWTEILIDVAYQFPHKLDLYKDFYVGPGALPTAKTINPKGIPSEIINVCVNIELPNFPYLQYKDKPVLLSAENWEGIFCEYRKYCNLTKGKGRKRLYLSKED